MKGNEICKELAEVNLSPSMREIQIAVMLRLAMRIGVLGGKLLLECTFRSHTAAEWLKDAVEEAYSLPAELKKEPSQAPSSSFQLSFRSIEAKKLLLFSRLLDVKTKRIVPSFPAFVDVSSIPVAKTVWRGAFLARGEAPTEKSGAKIYCSFPELASELEEAASTLGVGVQINSRGRHKSVEVAPAAQSVKLLNLIGAREGAKRASEVYERRGDAEAKHVVTQLFEANRKRSFEASHNACERIRWAFHVLEGRQIKPELRMAGELRLAHPTASLSELGNLADPPISKDAVAGRMRRLYRMALDAEKAQGEGRSKY